MISQKVIEGNTIIFNPGKVLDNDNAHEMSDAISAAQTKGHKYIVMDMAELEFLSSAGIGSILGAVKISRERGGDIILCNPSKKILHILKVLDLCDYLTIRSSQQAVKEFSVPGG